MSVNRARVGEERSRKLTGHINHSREQPKVGYYQLLIHVSPSGRSSLDVDEPGVQWESFGSCPGYSSPHFKSERISFLQSEEKRSSNLPRGSNGDLNCSRGSSINDDNLSRESDSSVGSRDS